MAAPAPNTLLIVNYHYIRQPDYLHPGIHPLAPDDFVAQVRALKDRFVMATPDEVVAFAHGEHAFSSPAVFLTFDDGLLDHLFVADVLDDLGIRSAFFISSCPLMERRAVSTHKIHWLRATTPGDRYRDEFMDLLRDCGDEPVLTPRQLEQAQATYVYDTPKDGRLKYLMNFVLPPEWVDEIPSRMLASRGLSEAAFCESVYILEGTDLAGLVRRGHVLGCHGHSHRPFATLDDDVLAEEIKACNGCLTDLAGQRPTWVSYPFGSPSAIPRDPDAFCHRFGFTVGLTLSRDWNEPQTVTPDSLKRINTNEVWDFV